MKNLFLTGLIAFLTINLTMAQSADEIVDNYLKNIGGKEKLSQIKFLHIKAITKSQGMEIPVEM
jgi:hypothetical protein